MKTIKVAIIAKTVAVAVVASGVLLGVAGPADATTGTMHGDPAAAAKYWRYQQYWDDCVEPSEEDIIAMAQSTTSSRGPGPIYTRPADPRTRTQARAPGLGTSRRCWRGTASAP